MPRFIRITGIVLLVWVFVPAQGYAGPKAARKSRTPLVTAETAYAVDYTNRRVLFARDIHRKCFPASTVKLMTALVVLESKDLDEWVPISARAAHIQPTRAGLKRQARYRVRDLLRVLLATSANDAGVALAESVAGSEEDFADLMNKKARALGMRDSRFTNATGLPDKQQVSSVYDLFLLTRAALSVPFVKSALEEESVTIAGTDEKLITRRNHNKLLWRVAYPRVLGKTGYTITARHCYAGIAYYEDRRVCVVIMKSRKPWSDIYALLGIPVKKKK